MKTKQPTRIQISCLEYCRKKQITNTSDSSWFKISNIQLIDFMFILSLCLELQLEIVQSDRLFSIRTQLEIQWTLYLAGGSSTCAMQHRTTEKMKNLHLHGHYRWLEFVNEKTGSSNTNWILANKWRHRWFYIYLAPKNRKRAELLFFSMEQIALSHYLSPT